MKVSSIKLDIDKKQIELGIYLEYLLRQLVKNFNV